MQKRAFFNLTKEKGAAITEYSLLLGGMILATIGILRILGIDISTLFCRVAQGIGAEVDCDNDALFADDFSDGLDQWDFDMGEQWDEEEGELCAGPGGEHRAYANGSTSNNYTVSFDATLLEGNGYGLFFRASGNRINGYTFQYDPGYDGGQFIIRRWVNGYEIWPPFAANGAPAGYQWYDVKRHIDVVVQNDSIRVNIDGATAVSGQDATYEEGQVGLRVWHPGKACFDNFVVQNN